MKFWLSSLVVVAAIIAAVFFFWWRPQNAVLAEPMFRTATSKRGEIVQSVTATGQLSPLTTVEVGSQVSGRIAKRYVDFNDPVKAGQLLAEIDPSTYLARVTQAEAELDSARANLDSLALVFAAIQSAHTGQPVKPGTVRKVPGV